MSVPERAIAAREGGAFRRHELLSAGVGAGLLGGLLMLVTVMVGASNAGIGALAPLAAVGSTFFGPEALAFGARVTYGVVLLALAASAFGAVFVALVPREMSPACAAGLGAGYALFVVGLMMSAVVPWVNPTFRDDMQVVGGTWIIAHGLYGAVLGLAPVLRRALAGEPIAGPPAQARTPGR